MVLLFLPVLLHVKRVWSGPLHCTCWIRITTHAHLTQSDQYKEVLPWAQLLGRATGRWPWQWWVRWWIQKDLRSWQCHLPSLRSIARKRARMNFERRVAGWITLQQKLWVTCSGIQRIQWNHLPIGLCHMFELFNRVFVLQCGVQSQCKISWFVMMLFGFRGRGRFLTSCTCSSKAPTWTRHHVSDTVLPTWQPSFWMNMMLYLLLLRPALQPASQETPNSPNSSSSSAPNWHWRFGRRCHPGSWENTWRGGFWTERGRIFVEHTHIYNYIYILIYTVAQNVSV